MIYFLPLESYTERYTFQQSGPGGWFESYWRKEGVKFTRISLWDRTSSIKQGAIVDYCKRAEQSFYQIRNVLHKIERGEIGQKDVIYFDDFWTPGIEQIAYALSFVPEENRPRMYGFCYAQSPDEFDFTAKLMNKWIGWFEKGIAQILDGIFVASTLLRDLLEKSWGNHNYHVVGLPFNSNEVRSLMPSALSTDREDAVLFTSRWDEEKNPRFFLEVAKKVQAKHPKVVFKICTSAPNLRSNDPDLIELLKSAQQTTNIQVMQGLSKAEYYRLLCESKVQVNTSLQDWISYTLLEASVAGAYPIYPRFRSFPEVFGDDSPHLYQPENSDEASEKIVDVLRRNDLWTEGRIKEREWIHAKCDRTIEKITDVLLGESK